MPGFPVLHYLSEFAQPIQYCSLQHQIFTTRHIHSWVSFLLWPRHFIRSGAISNCPPLFPSSILGTFWPGRLIFWCHVFYLFILSMGFPRQEYWSGLSFPPTLDYIFSELFTMPIHLGWPCMVWLRSSFSYASPLPQQGCDPWRGFGYTTQKV